MIEQILTMNNFEFNGEYYLQIQGTAMGTRMASSYANIFMGKLETQLLQYRTCHMIREETFKSHSTGTTHKTRSTFTCKTRNLVYLIQCRKCGLQYVGETANPLHIRMNGYRSDIHTWKTDKPVAAHFNLPDHTLDDLQVMGIEKIHNNDTEWRKHRESYWIFTLDTLAPTGMNLED